MVEKIRPIERLCFFLFLLFSYSSSCILPVVVFLQFPCHWNVECVRDILTQSKFNLHEVERVWQMMKLLIPTLNLPIIEYMN